MKMIKKIIFLFSITYCFILQSSSKEEKTKNWYPTLLSNRSLGLPASAIIGGSLAAGLKYVFDNNKFLSSFRAAEKIKHASYFKFFGTGGLGTVGTAGLYELLKRLTKPKKTNDDEKNMLDSSPRPSENSEEIEEKRTTKDDKEQKNSYHDQENIQNLAKQQIEKEKLKNKEIKVVCILPDNLYSLFMSESASDSLETNHTVKEIERILGEGEIQKYSESEFHFCSSEERFRASRPTRNLRGAQYAAAIYLINEDQKDFFKDMLKQFSLYDFYVINPCSKENLLCYVLPLESSLGKEGNKIHSLEISSNITKDNIDAYSFKLSKEDAKKIKLDRGGGIYPRSRL
jgi:hypothetical protein